MPYFEMRDQFGTTWCCHTSDPEVAEKWLLEWARVAVNMNFSLGPWMLRVMPMFPDGKTPDWPANGLKGQTEMAIQKEGMEQLQQLLEHLHD